MRGALEIIKQGAKNVNINNRKCYKARQGVSPDFLRLLRLPGNSGVGPERGVV